VLALAKRGMPDRISCLKGLCAALPLAEKKSLKNDFCAWLKKGDFSPAFADDYARGAVMWLDNAARLSDRKKRTKKGCAYQLASYLESRAPVVKKEVELRPDMTVKGRVLISRCAVLADAFKHSLAEDFLNWLNKRGFSAGTAKDYAWGADFWRCSEVRKKASNCRMKVAQRCALQLDKFLQATKGQSEDVTHGERRGLKRTASRMDFPQAAAPEPAPVQPSQRLRRKGLFVASTLAKRGKVKSSAPVASRQKTLQVRHAADVSAEALLEASYGRRMLDADLYEVLRLWQFGDNKRAKVGEGLSDTIGLTLANRRVAHMPQDARAPACSEVSRAMVAGSMSTRAQIPFPGDVVYNQQELAVSPASR